MSENCLMVERKSTHCKGNKNAKTEPTHAVTNSVFSHTHTHTQGRNTLTHAYARTNGSSCAHTRLSSGVPYTHTRTHPTTTKTGIQGQMVVWVLWAIQIRVSYSAVVQKQAGSTHLRTIHTQNQGFPSHAKQHDHKHRPHNTHTTTQPGPHVRRRPGGRGGSTPHTSQESLPPAPPPQAPSPRPRRYVTTRCRGCWEM